VPKYEPSQIEPKWQKYWDDHKTFAARENTGKPKFYALDMFPYPSGAGMHVGHPEGYTATDIVCRYKRMQGFEVLHPMGWDAYGLPAEQYAIKTGTHPRITTKKNIDNFIRQIKSLGFSYDWDREINTTDPSYFKWTQWIFKQLFNHAYDPQTQKAIHIDKLIIPKELQNNPQKSKEWKNQQRLAYLAEVPVWWCPELGTVLANEEVIDGKSERGNHPCERRPLKQWMLRITSYADRLLGDLESVDWSDSIKQMQRNWIGKSTGAKIDFEVASTHEKITVFTTRPDTLFGASYMVLAPEHPLASTLCRPEYQAELEHYQKITKSKSELERGIDREKTGVFLGSFALNPVNKNLLPIWVSDFVMMGYGTGAIMSVPAHDERDHAFAKKFSLPILAVIEGPDTETAAYTGSGKLKNSDFLNGLEVNEAKKTMIEWLTAQELGTAETQYKLRDWLFSRQRYWGEPFPIVHTSEGLVALPDEELPLLPPELSDFSPTGTLEPPLAKVKDWVQYSGKAGVGFRETNTMPQWAGSCWYYLRYIDPHNDQAFCAKEKENYWMPVDLYIGGAEHAVLHLLYSRFWHKFLFDLNLVTHPEPFQKLVNQGIILGENGEKMSKSLGNVVSPDEIVSQYGADCMRVYEMFMGPLERMKPWSTAGLEGPFRFLKKLHRWLVGEEQTVSYNTSPLPASQAKILHQTIKKVSEDIENLRLNTAISQLMICLNELSQEAPYQEAAEILTQLTSPFAPHLAEELWEKLGHSNSITYQPWPHYDENLAAENSVTVVFQVNGKVRAECTVPKGTSKETLESMALSNEKIKSYTEKTQLLKIICVPDKLVNLVVKAL